MTDAALAAAQHLGLTVPDDLSLVSLAGLPGPRPGAPAMARVILDFEQAGAAAATLLLKLRRGSLRAGGGGAAPGRVRPARVHRPAGLRATARRSRRW